MDNESSTQDTKDAEFGDSLTDHLPALISRLDPRGRYQFANRHFATTNDLNRDQIAGRGFEKIHSAAEYAAARPQLEAIMSGSPACSKPAAASKRRLTEG